MMILRFLDTGCQILENVDNYLQHIGIPPKPNTACTDVDYKAIVYGVQLAIHFMRKNSTPGGKIVATASIAAVHPHSSYPEYCGAKAAVWPDLLAVRR